jgi:hypothetical protein
MSNKEKHGIKGGMGSLPPLNLSPFGTRFVGKARTQLSLCSKKENVQRSSSLSAAKMKKESFICSLMLLYSRLSLCLDLDA